MADYRLDCSFVETPKFTIQNDVFRTPFHHAQILETNCLGLYIAKTACGGQRASRWFIENGRFYAVQIRRYISAGTVETLKLDKRYWETAE